MARVSLTARLLGAASLAPGDYWDTSLTGFGLRVLPSGSKRWMVLYRRSRRTFASYPATSLKKARARAGSLLEAAESGADPFHGVATVTVAELSRFFMDSYAQHRHSERWVRYQRWCFDKYILPRFGKRLATSLTRGELALWLDELAADTPTTANMAKAVLGRVYSWALSRELVTSNPLTGLPRPAELRPRERVLDNEELVAVLEACRRDATAFAAILELMVFTAQRGIDIRRMEWAHIAGNWWTLPLSKGGTSQTVHLNDQALEVVKRQRGRHRRFVFPAGGSPGATKPAQANSSGARRIRDLASVEFRPHDLRRTAATHMARLGVNPFVIGKILGHADPRGITSIYDRSSYDREKEKALTMWGDHVAELLAGEQESKASGS